MSKRLDGVTVALPESRFAAEFTTLFEREGARVRSCPLMTEALLEDRSSTEQFINLATAASLDMAIFMTGIGVRLILDHADVLDQRVALLAALSEMKVVSRGSKSTAALRKAGVRIHIIPEVATSEGLIATLSAYEVRHSSIAIQLYGTPNPPLTEALESRGAKVFPISVYSYSTVSSPEDVASFIRDIISGSVQVIVFTSAPQVHALFESAVTVGVEAALRLSLTTATRVASIGEVTSHALETYNVRPHIVPDEPKMGPMVKAICSTPLS